MSELDSQNKRGSATGTLPIPGGQDVLPEREHLAGLYRLTEGNAAAIIGGLVAIATLMPFSQTIDCEAEIGTLQAVSVIHTLEGGQNVDMPLGYLSAKAELFPAESFFLEELSSLSAVATVLPLMDMVGGDFSTLRAEASLYHPDLHVDHYITLEELTAVARTWPLIAPAAGRTTVLFSAQRPKQVAWIFQGKRPEMVFIGAAEIHSEILRLPTLTAVALIRGITGDNLNVIGTLSAKANVYSFGGDAIGGLEAIASIYPLAPPEDIGCLEAVATIRSLTEDYELRTLRAIAEMQGFEPMLGTLQAIAALYPLAVSDEIGTLEAKARLIPFIVSGESTIGTLQATATLVPLVSGVVSVIGTLNAKARMIRFNASAEETIGTLQATATLNTLAPSIGAVTSIGPIAATATAQLFDVSISETGTTGRLAAVATLIRPATVISCSSSLSKLSATASLKSLTATIT